jgi:rhomboid protease GluP
MQTPSPLIDEVMQELQPRRVVIDLPHYKPLLAYILLGLLIVVHLYVQTLDNSRRGPGSLYDFYIQYANGPDVLAQGEYYRLLTSMFLHGGWVHLMFNGLALFSFGQEVERRYGQIRFLLIYFLGGLGGSVFSLLQGDNLSVGASGAIFALFGAVAAYYYQNQAIYREHTWDMLRQLGMLALINFAFGIFSNISTGGAGIDNAAHLGGLIGGVALGFCLSPRYHLQPRSEGGHMGFYIEDQQNPLWRLLGPLLFVALLAGLLFLA